MPVALRPGCRHLPPLGQPDRCSPHCSAAAKEASAADLLMATAYVESGWKQSAVSATGPSASGTAGRDGGWVAAVLLRQGGLDVPAR